MYGNLLTLMEQRKIKMVKDNNLHASLASIQFEYSEDSKRLLIYGSYSHITEALIRAAWSVRTKGLKLFVA